jgi:hypothetical protein
VEQAVAGSDRGFFVHIRTVTPCHALKVNFAQVTVHLGLVMTSPHAE